MSEGFLDRVGKSGPIVTVLVGLLALAAAYGANSLQTASLVRSQETTNAKLDAVYSEIRKISEAVVSVQVTSQYQRESIAELRLRVREIEGHSRR